MSYKTFVTILFLTTIFLFHLNPCSSDMNRLQLFFQKQKTSTKPTFELPNRIIYPSQTIFREFILPTLNQEITFSLHKIFESKDPSISPQSFLPPKRFFKSNTILMQRKSYGHQQQIKQKVIYSFNFGVKTQYSKFKPMLYSPTNKKLEILNSGKFFDKFIDTTNIKDGCIISFFTEYFAPFRQQEISELDKNQTVMIATNPKSVILILEDSTDEKSKKYSLIYHDEYKLIWGRERSLLLKGYNGNNVQFPEDINYILKNYFSQKSCLSFLFNSIKKTKQNAQTFLV